MVWLEKYGSVATKRSGDGPPSHEKPLVYWMICAAHASVTLPKMIAIFKSESATALLIWQKNKHTHCFCRESTVSLCIWPLV